MSTDPDAPLGGLGIGGGAVARKASAPQVADKEPSSPPSTSWDLNCAMDGFDRAIATLKGAQAILRDVQLTLWETRGDGPF